MPPISPDTIEFARQGVFPEGLLANLSKERVNRFFTRDAHQYAAKRDLRESVVFALHDVTGDPPFSNMDLISCRNLLIYMNRDLQDQVLRIFHYSLKPGGILFLGTSETIGDAQALFTPIDTKNKLYRRLDGEANAVPTFRLPGYGRSRERDPQSMRNAEQKETEFQAVRKTRQLVEQTLLETHASPAVLINEEGEILYFHGETGRYLSPPKGAPGFHISKMARPELHSRLMEAMEKVKHNREPVWVEPFSIRQNDHFLSLGLSVKPLSGENRSRYILVEFLEDGSSDTRPDATSNEDVAVRELRRELRATRHELHATIEELETANEELKSSNEELQANNEELESSKEELQSINEELETVNAQQSRKNEDLMTAEDDLNNLFAASEIGTLFLDTDLGIKRFNPKAKAIFNVREDRDMGRSIKDITSNLAYETLSQDADEVLDTLVRKEIQVPSMDGASQYMVRIVPYRSRKNVIEGLIITFLDITRYEALRTGPRDFKTFFNNTLSALREPVLLLNEDLTVLTANDAFYRMFQTSSKETENRSFFDLGKGEWDIPKLRESLEKVIPHNEGFEEFELKGGFLNLGERKMVLNARRIETGGTHPALVMVSFKDPAE
ncbi:MAG: PAS domain-containing protein [Deltaproteobacteria bacterium]|nr:PAS domain-containing protein [Deltaproteobacteria bacterium]